MKAKAILPILILILLSIALQASSAQVDLSLDLEIKEPEDIIFNLIVDIAVDSENSIFILDMKEKVLYKFNEEGKFQKKIGRSGQGPGEFERPRSVFIDTEDNIYILDYQNRRVEVFKNNGDFTKSIKLNRVPSGGKNSIAVDENRNFYISGFYSDDNVALSKYSPTGEFLKALPLPNMKYDGIPNISEFDQKLVNQYVGGGSLCFGEENRIYFSYIWPYKICILENEENILSDISGTNNLNWIPLIFSAKPEGTLYGEYTSSQKIFWLNNEYLVNSIQCIDWEGNPKVKIPQENIIAQTGLDKYYKFKRKFAVVDIFDKDGQFIASSEINDKIVFLNSDNKNRILGVKKDGEDIPTIVRYKVKINKIN